MNPTTNTEVSEFIIGSAVASDDAALGKLTRVVIDPIARKITHLVVQPKHHHDTGRLVPVGLVASTTEDEIKLNCTESDFSALANSDSQTGFVPR
jgi:uncharacterized protein YrrD